MPFSSRLVGPFVVLAATCALAQESQPTPIVRERNLGVMGTSLQIRVLGNDARRLDAAIDAAITELRRVEDLMTDWRPSPLMTLNDAAGKGPVRVPAELAAIIVRAQEVSRLTGGAFDCTFAAVGRLWDFKRRPPVIPDAAAVRAALALVGSDKIEIRRIERDADDAIVSLPAGMRIGLGGIAKGYGVDRAMAVLMRHGIRHAIVNAGGDMKVLGKDASGRNWEIGIKHPRAAERAMAALKVSNTCVVTSGDYERFFEHQGRRYHHILDPRTGFPSTACMSATVVAPSAEFADALATALCVLGPKAGLRLVERLPRVEAILVGMDGEVTASTGLADALLTQSPRSRPLSRPVGQ